MTNIQILTQTKKANFINKNFDGKNEQNSEYGSQKIRELIS